MSGAGSALMGIGSARGDNRAVEAAEAAISSPLLEQSMDGARGVLLSIAGGSDLGLFEINDAAQLVTDAAHPDANIIFGAVIDDALGDEVRVTVIAAGFDGGSPAYKPAEPTRKATAPQPAVAAAAAAGAAPTPGHAGPAAAPGALRRRRRARLPQERLLTAFETWTASEPIRPAADRAQAIRTAAGAWPSTRPAAAHRLYAALASAGRSSTRPVDRRPCRRAAGDRRSRMATWPAMVGRPRAARPPGL